MTEVETELVNCPRCAGLEGLRQRCGTCGGVGKIRQAVEPGHETLSAMRSKTNYDPGRYRDGKTHEAVEPNRNDPTWAGHDPR